jgi:hypothetical protein
MEARRKQGMQTSAVNADLPTIQGKPSITYSTGNVLL